MYSPADKTLGIDITRRVFDAARHPKSFVALDGDDHLLTLAADAPMTLRMYADRKKWFLDKVSVSLRHSRIHAKDCADCETQSGQFDRVERVIELTGALDDEQRARLLEIADRCPVHRTLHSEVDVHTTIAEPS